MTETRTFYYTDKLETPNSTAVDTLWYSRDSRELFIRFNSGNIAGYASFDPGYWQGILNAYQEGASIGSLVSRQIKGMFPGVCGDIDPQPKTYADTVESIPTEVTEVAGSKGRFLVKFNVALNGAFAINANSVDEAIRLFNESTDVTAYLNESDLSNGVKVTEVTQYFDN